MMSFFTYVQPTDWLLGLLFLAGLITTILVAERLLQILPRQNEPIRKSVHMTTGVAIMLTPVLFQSGVPVFSISVLFVLVNAWAMRQGKLVAINGNTRLSLGTIYYPLATAILVLLFWDRQVMILLLSFSLLAFADPVAGLVGQYFSGQSYMPAPWDKKSLLGSSTMYLVSFVLMVVGLFCFRNQHNFATGTLLVVSSAIAMLATACEALSYRGSDNLSVPLVAAVALSTLLQSALQTQFLLGEGLAILVALVAWRGEMLDIGGAIAAGVVGTIIFGIGGWLFSLPILVFFASVSALSKLPKRWSGSANEIIAKGGRRDAAQVLANGFLPTVLVIGSIKMGRDLSFWLSLGAVAAVTADSWATEVGLMFSGRPRSIVSGKIVSPGFSGGVSLPGVFGALVGAALIAATGWLATELDNTVATNFQLSLGVCVAGMLAHFVDSILGATLQRQNRCSTCGKTTEREMHCGRRTTHFAGFSWLDNDLVNVACGLSGVVLMSMTRKLF